MCVCHASYLFFISLFIFLIDGIAFLQYACYFVFLTDIYINPEAITASLSTLSVDAQKRAEKDSKKKEAKAAAAEAREAEAKKEAMVYIKRVERNKRKYVTAVSGLEAHGMDLKKVAKEFGKKCELAFLSPFSVCIGFVIVGLGVPGVSYLGRGLTYGMGVSRDREQCHEDGEWGGGDCGARG